MSRPANFREYLSAPKAFAEKGVRSIGPVTALIRLQILLHDADQLPGAMPEGVFFEKTLACCHAHRSPLGVVVEQPTIALYGLVAAVDHDNFFARLEPRFQARIGIRYHTRAITCQFKRARTGRRKSRGVCLTRYDKVDPGAAHIFAQLADRE